MTMMITEDTVRAVCAAIRERSPWISGYRRWPDGKVRRYIEWRRASEAARRRV